MDPIARTRRNLLEASYTVDDVMARLTPEAHDGLARNSTIPARVELAGADDPQATLIRLFMLQESVTADIAEQALAMDAATQLGLIEQHGEQVRALVSLRPYGFEHDGGGWGGWLVSDHVPGLDHRIVPANPNHVLGVSPASTTLAQMTIPDRVESALDLGTGCGVQSAHLSTHADRVVATDVNPRALHLASIGAALNQQAIDFRSGSLYEPVAEEKFDLIVTNPPYVMSPPDGTRLTYRETTAQSDSLVEAIVRASVDHLTADGVCQVLANWAVTSDDWVSRLASWAPRGADMHVIERERLDPYAYIEMWLSDAGLQGSHEWEPAYHQWLDYFEHLGIVGIGMGWITVVNSGTDDPVVRVESWPYDVAQPVGAALGAFRDEAAWSRLSDEEIWASRWVIADHVRQETFGQPGAADPTNVIMRQHGGLKRARNVDTALGGILGACDGELPLRAIWQAVAMILDQPGDDTADAVMTQIRQCITDGYLVRANDQ